MENKYSVSQFPDHPTDPKRPWGYGLWHRLTEPHPAVQGTDQRRLATLASATVLGLIVLAVVLELTTVAFINWEEEYTGYRQTIVIEILLILAYGVSRTRHFRMAAFLMVLVSLMGIFVSAIAEPTGILGGLFDYLIIPIWLGSMFFRPRVLLWVILASVGGVLLIPLFVPDISFNLLLIGPAGFVLVVSVVLFITIYARDRLEKDRQSDLMASEHRAQREAVRAQALLRVAHHLNAHLDQEMLLVAICEETAKALDVPVAVVSLYDKKSDSLYPEAHVGLSEENYRLMPPLARAFLDQGIQTFDNIYTFPDLQSYYALPEMKAYQKMNLRSLVLSTINFEGEIIGCITALTVGVNQHFDEDQQLLLKGLSDQAALAIVNTRLYKDARRRLDHLQALRAIDVAITSNHGLQQTLEVLLEQIAQRLDVDAAVVLLMNEQRQYLEYVASRGFHTLALRYTKLRIGEGTAGKAAEQRTVVYVADLCENPQSFSYAPLMKEEKMVSYFAVPLIVKGQINGVLEIFNRSLLEPDEEWLAFLEALAGQAAIAIDNSTLFNDLQQTNQELAQAYDSTIEGWSRALDLRDKETEGHTLRVTEMTLRLARAMNLSEDELIQIRRGTLLHDIGKMGIPDNILLKPGALTEQEWEIMRKHPVYAYEMLLPVEYLRPALDIPYYHHEKWDGTGYPHGLRGETIPLPARIFAVVDVWDALSSDRPYRPAWPPDRVLEHIRAGSGTHFDPKVVEVFLELLGEA